MKSKLLILTGFILIFAHSFSQQISPEDYQKQLNEANHESLIGNYTKAIAQYQELLELDEAKNKALLYNLLAQVYLKKANYQTAQDYAENALEMSQNTLSENKLQEAIALDIIGEVENHKRAFDNSLDYHFRAFEIKKTINNIDSSQIASSYYQIGSVKQLSGEYDEAKSFLNKALKINLNPTPKNNILLSSIYQTFGRINYDTGRYDEALSDLLKSMTYALKELSDDNTYLDQLYNETGIVYMGKGNYYEALKYLQKALSLNVKKNSDNIHPDQVRIHFNIGAVYANLGLKDKALFHTQKTINMGKKVFGEDNIDFHFAYSQLGRLYGDERGIPYVEKAITLLQQDLNPRTKTIISFYDMYLAEIYTTLKDYNNAQIYLKKAVTTRTNLQGENNFNTIKSVNGLAKNFLLLKEYNNALLHANNSIDANSLDYALESIPKQTFEVTKVQDPHLFVEAIETKIEINLALYKEGQNIERLKRTYQLSKQLDQIIQKTRNSLRDYGDKLYFTGLVKKAYERHVELCLLLYEIESDSDYKNEALKFSEKSKSNVLRELVSNTKIKEEVLIHDDILLLEKEVNNSLAKTRTDMVTEESKSQVDTMKVYAFQEKIVNLIHQKDSLEKHIETNYPKYFKLKYENEVIDVPQIQSFLDDNTTLVEFLIAEDIVFSFIINKNSYHIKSLPVEDLGKKIETLNNSITDKNQTLFQSTSAKLYNELFQPIESHITGQNVIIIPDEVLWHLQFDLLLNNSKTTDDNHLNYLLYDYAFSYANSATFLNESYRTTTVKNDTRDCLAFSYSNEGDENENYEKISLKRLRNSKVDLPGTRLEVKALSNIIDGTYYYGRNANEHNFKNNVSNYKVTHLALHAEIDSLDTENLKILFSQFNDSTNVEDNILYSHELYNLDISSDLVTLSACSTGAGKINNGEGIMSIGNAFQYAGAKSLLLSRWDISDETTPAIIEEFYKNLKSGHNKSEALRLAKITHLEDSGVLQSQPFYWGSFYVLGNDGAIEFKSSFNYMLLLLIGAILAIAFYFYKNRQKS